MKYFSLYLIVFSLCLSILPAQSFAGSYEVDYKNSYVTFSGEHAGDEFTGIFQDWSANILFDESDLENSTVIAEFDLSSATTENKVYDGTLPQKDWFDTKAHPKAMFVSTSIAKKDADKNTGEYVVSGDLTLRGKTLPVTFDFQLSDLNRADVIMDASMMINRLDFDIGLKSDPEAEWVSKNIAVVIHLSTNMK